MVSGLFKKHTYLIQVYNNIVQKVIRLLLVKVGLSKNRLSGNHRITNINFNINRSQGSALCFINWNLIRVKRLRW